jgi:hypothetical protein
MINPVAAAIMTNETTTYPPVMTSCPSCGAMTVFTFIGVQRWPRRVAQMMGTKETITLWKCGNCQTTISNVDEQSG